VFERVDAAILDDRLHLIEHRSPHHVTAMWNE
jgi:hypothetical protein